ncbi:MAG: hypothetical protein JNN05_09275 [Candidatus Omnitrophica bacterium]|nr:hypothetical protein [Candidatus Omnitrophota bacterium]
MNELIIFGVCAVIILFVIGTLVQNAIVAKSKKKSLQPDHSTVATTKITPLSTCTCSPPQEAKGWRCAVSPCKATERLISTTCVPTGCGPSKGIEEQKCVEDSECCDEYRDTAYCGTGAEAPDCPIGTRIVQKVCGEGKTTYACRQDFEEVKIDSSPSCRPHCLGQYSPNEAAANVNPSLPIICPGDDTGLQSSNGPWVRDKNGVGLQGKIIGTGINVCSQNPLQKCESYCLNGYKVSADGTHCESISCQKDPILLKHSIVDSEFSPGSTQTYDYSLPNSCPLTDESAFILFNITLGEAILHVWNNESSQWDKLSTSGDNNNLFKSLRLYPLLAADKKYFSDNQIKWKITQADGDKDSYFAKIIAQECGHPETTIYKNISDPNESLPNDTTIQRTFTIPAECAPFNESSHITVDIQLINANLQVFDVNNNLWSDVATSGKDNQLFLSLKYHPLGFENRYFKNDQISWKVTAAAGSGNNFQAGISVAECYQNMCSGVPKEGWVTALGTINSCTPLCASIGLKPGVSPEGMSCASGKNRPMSGTGSISYFHGCAIGLNCNGNLVGPTQTHLTQGNCYRAGQNEEDQETDIAVACYCQ